MQTIATACVYFRRFYARRSFKDIDPFLLAPTCLTLASKVEESGLVPCNKLIITTTSACKKGFFLKKKKYFIKLFLVKKWPYLNQELTIRSQVLQEAEFYVLEIMDCCLIVYHPYRPLNHMIQVKKK